MKETINGLFVKENIQSQGCGDKKKNFREQTFDMALLQSIPSQAADLSNSIGVFNSKSSKENLAR